MGGSRKTTLKELKKEEPTSYSDVFRVLASSGIISNELSEELKKMAKFRNVLAHLYAEVDLKIVYDIIQNKLGEIKQFLKEIKKN